MASPRARGLFSAQKPGKIQGWQPPLAGGAGCFALRLLAVWQDWHLPKVPVW